ncbi:caspase-2 isoform X1 [Cynoglossus semilaevis]|uniref:caspase-2 isoform X1 n=1 Tax=Cynoglossus semilaevis TaxID=244447 RepID=UPI000495A59F|nr:caspase-2 isoform X1 [Cynoglossus semilaevis]XP_016893089.1 caspase-2 isoform X1 [Cynoglossus semilaevis]
MLECGMLERDRQTLKRRSASLLKHLMVDEMLLMLLQAEDILTGNMAESIMAEPTSQKRSWHLLQILPKRGPGAFSCFCAALRETNQQFLSDMLTQCPERDGVERHMKRLSDSSLPLSTPEEAAAKRARTQESMEFSLDADSPIKSPVLPCSADFYHSHCQKAYSMTSSPRGLALVISNVTFDPSVTTELDTRKGGEVDNEVLRKVFTELDYLVSLHVDLTAEAMKSCIESFSRRPDHRAVDSCVVCLLSHGVEGAVYGTDGQLLQLDWVFKAFDNAHCPLLQNKPKMFFIQACRGDEMDVGVEQIDGPIRTGSPSCEQRDAGRERQNESHPGQGGHDGRRIKLPQRSDMICGFASLKGQRISTAAMRNTKKGSWFIQDLDMALRLHARDTHLADILMQVNARIKEREGYAPGTPHHRCKEMSEFTSSLCKDLYLFPKYRLPSMQI